LCLALSDWWAELRILQDQEKPLGRNPAARKARNCEGSGFDRIAALAVFTLRRDYGVAHLFADGPREEAPDGMRLPAGRLHQVFGCDAARLLQKLEYLVGFAAIAATGFLLRFGRFLGRAGLLSRLTRLRRDVAATCARAGPFRGLGLLSNRRFGRFGCFSVRCHAASPLFDHGHDIDHSGALGKQGKSVSRVAIKWRCGWISLVRWQSLAENS
jgi:hypothetical protein